MFDDKNEYNISESRNNLGDFSKNSAKQVLKVRLIIFRF